MASSHHWRAPDSLCTVEEKPSEEPSTIISVIFDQKETTVKKLHSPSGKYFPFYKNWLSVQMATNLNQYPSWQIDPKDAIYLHSLLYAVLDVFHIDTLPSLP